MTREDIQPLIDVALSEDIGDGDITSLWTVPERKIASADFVAKASGVVAGMDVVSWVFDTVDSTTTVEAKLSDGEATRPGDIFATVSGPARARLTGERTALNFLQRLSGVATQTRRFVDAIAKTSARITDTRKTTPGWRHLQKWAVIQGGGVNHRIGLYDAVLIKENHAAACGGVAEAATRADCGRPARNRPAYLCRGRDDTRSNEFDVLGPRSDYVG